ncbi:MAG: TonB-dependent receptor plug domain-containing protein, partial [Cyclobacteriaceae bacterium]
MSKLTFYILVINLSFVSLLVASEGTFSQSNELTEKNKYRHLLDIKFEIIQTNMLLTDLFKEVESKTGLRFIYFKKDVNSKSLKLDPSSSNLKEVLIDAALKANLNFKRINQKIVVKKHQSTEPVIEESFYQEQRISGKVTSYEDNEPLPGVNILVKNKNMGTVTDLEGNFSLNAVSSEDVLVFSSVGYTREEVLVGNRSVIDVSLVQDLTQLQELVVIGYGEQERKDLTGSVASIKSKEITQVTTPSLDNAIQGQIPGVQVFAASGAPGGSMQVLIRGASSVTGNNIPLYVIDGIPLFGDDNLLSKNISDGAGPNPEAPAISILSSINPDDIESIDVLKDASATAIYGARAANGVVIITTKRGKAGKPAANIKINTGVSQLGNTIPVINGLQYAQLNQEARFSWGNPFPFSLVETDSIRAATGTEYGTDWQKEVFRIAPVTEINASLSGGSESARYNVSGGLFDQQGIV